MFFSSQLCATRSKLTGNSKMGLVFNTNGSSHHRCAHHRGPHLDYQHQVYLQEGTTAPTLSPPAEKSKPPSTHPHHLLQGYHWERADQLHHCLVRKLLCSRPQDPPAHSEHRCKNHWCPSPLHPGHFPYTMLQQSKKYRGGPHPPLPQSLPAPTLR